MDASSLYMAHRLERGWFVWVADGSGLAVIEEDYWVAMTEIRKLRKETLKDEKKAEKFFGIELR